MSVHVQAPGPPAGADGLGALPPAPWLRGWERTLAGERIFYHAPHPQAQTAILVRATDGRMAMQWETEAVPLPARVARDAAAPATASAATATAPNANSAGSTGGDPATFIWMCGLATHKGAHAFTLHGNSRPLLRFRSGRDASERSFAVQGESGSSLRFEAVMKDQFEELFGFMWLTLPRSLAPPGAPVRLRVTTEAGGSPDWFMLYEYRLQPSIEARAEEAVLRGKQGPLRVVRLEVCHLAPPSRVLLRATPGPDPSGTDPAEGPSALFPDPGAHFTPPWSLPLQVGYNAFLLPVAANAARATITFEPERPQPPGTPRVGPIVAPLEIPLPPVTPREFWLLPHSHVDIGYSDPQPHVERKQWAHLELAMRLARETRDHPAPARFRWNVEVLWAIRTWYDQAREGERAAFVEAVRADEIGLQATLANVLTGLCHPEELLHLTDEARRFGRITGRPVDTAMITDIPGSTWNVVPALAQCGIRSLSSGPNYLPWHADGGDRIGSSARAWGDRPFWWISPSGEERLLFWMTGRGYSWFHGLNSGQIGAASTRAFLDYAHELRAREYPWSMVQVRYTVGGDNGPPDPSLPRFVRDWNERFVTPSLAIATSRQLTDEFIRRHGEALPEHRGDLTPYWEDGAASSARQTAMNRLAARLLVEAATLWSLRSPAPWPAGDFREAWNQVLLFSEHTWGAAESVSAPDSENSRAQWTWKEELAAEALRQARRLRALACAPIGDSDDASAPARGARPVDLINPTGWPQDGLAIVPRALAPASEVLVDAAGTPRPCQRLSSGDLLVSSEPLPAFGGARLYPAATPERAPVGPLAPHPPGPAGAPASLATTPASRPPSAAIEPGCAILENGRLRVVIDGESGTVTSVRLGGEGDAETIECVDTRRFRGLNACHYRLGLHPVDSPAATATGMAVSELGPLCAAIVVSRQAPGCRSLRTEYRLHAGRAELEVDNTVDKIPVREKESLHFAFPFAAENGRVTIDLGWAAIRPDRDQLPGSCRDFFCPHDAVRIEGPELELLFVSLDAPLVELGEMTDETPRERGFRAWRETTGASTTIFSYAMNNAWHTNYKADQEGEAVFRYRIGWRRPPAGPNGASMSCAAWARAAAARSVHAPVALPGRATAAAIVPPLAWDNPDVELSGLAPADDGRGWIVRLYNPTAGVQPVVLSGRLAAAVPPRWSDPEQRPGCVVDFPITLPPFGLRTLRLGI